MLDKKIKDLINKQINKELYSAYLYLDFACLFKEDGLDGFANWYDVQAKEEVDHAMRFIKYLQAVDEEVALITIEEPKIPGYKREDCKGGKCYMLMLEEGLGHEQYITSSINDIYEAADDAMDYRTMNFLDWFIAEQLEEEENARDLITKMSLFASEPKGLYLLDQELGERKYETPDIVIA